MTTRPDQIVISGQTVRDQFYGTAGTIYIYRKDTQQAAFARRGAHTNWGYPGYFLASIHDGSAWRKLQINKLVPYELRSYEYGRDADKVAAHLAGIIAQWRGVTAYYNQGTRSFSIPGREIAG